MTSFNRINENLNRLPGSEVSLSDSNVQSIIKKNPDGSISFQAFYGRRNLTININTNTLSYDVWNVIKDGYLPGNDIIVNIAPTVTIGSTGSTVAALSVPANISPQDTITIFNRGIVRGAGGTGGSVGGAGVPGGTALRADRSVKLINTGSLIGGGGGGGGGNPGVIPGSGKVAPSPSSGGGGGGGAGLNPGPASPGTAGTLLTGGAGGGPGGGSAAGGGAGGPIGTAGTASSQAAGLAGRAIQGTSNVTLVKPGQPDVTVAASNLVSSPSGPIIGTLI